MEYWSLWKLVLVCVGVAVKRTIYQRKVDVDMLNAVKSVLADVSSVSPSLWWSANVRNVTQHTLYGLQHIHISLTLINCTFVYQVWLSAGTVSYVTRVWFNKHNKKNTSEEQEVWLSSLTWLHFIFLFKFDSCSWNHGNKVENSVSIAYYCSFSSRRRVLKCDVISFANCSIYTADVRTCAKFQIASIHDS